jgi:hypothetical protein
VSKRHPNPRLVKINHSYDVGEVAALLGIHKNTVRAWIKGGLAVTDKRRPALILGTTLRAFLQMKRTRNKRPCQPGELYCFRCRAPKKPAGNMADFQPETEAVGNLTALCADCETIMHKRIGTAKLGLISAQIEVTVTEALKRIGDSDNPIVNSDFN